MIRKTGYSVQLSFDVPDAEKKSAEKASLYFNKLSNTLTHNLNHLDIMYDVFKKYETISTDEVYKHRAGLRKYRDQVIENFNKSKQIALRCVIALKPFSSDTQSNELVNSFISSTEEVEKQVNRFADLFDKLNSSEFRNFIIAGIEGVKKQASQLDQLINDRILPHIDGNILAKNWVTNISDKMQLKLKDKEPYIVELWKQRYNAVDDALDPTKR